MGQRQLMRVVLATGSVAAVMCLAVPAHADPPPLHQVTYTVTAQTPTRADIYYRETDPPNWADYSHNPYVFSPKAEVEVGPGAPWVLTVQLADPDRWAMVSATSGRGPATPAFHCELAVDGVVVATGDGPKGALCAVRHW
ncbi:hypothetical protein [Mycolicibacterium smegmatis]|nr:hypothetical protein [Mycolicibacterium smegmatis]